MPSTTESTTQVLTAVLVPQTLTEISNFSQYLDLLAMRIEWTIQQEIDRATALNAIENYIQSGGMSYPVLAQLQQDSPQQWAIALTHGNPHFQEQLIYCLETTFPVQITADPTALEIVKRTSLEEWLQLMVAGTREDWM
jgi:hypothetical protein